MNSTPHLSEDQIDDLLIGDLAAEPTAHLAGCEPCQTRVADAQAPIASFKAVSLAWSERRSATLPPQFVRTASPAWHRHAAWAATASAVLLVGIAVPMAKQAARSTPVAATAPLAKSSAQSGVVTASVQPAVQPQPAGARTVAASYSSQDEQIARDNRMLQAIDRELDASVQSPADAFGIDPAGSRLTLHGRNAPVQNLD